MLWPLLAFMVLVVALVGAMLTASHFLGERRREAATDAPYESGMVTTGRRRPRTATRLYVIAMLFVLFDLEAVFLFAWAISATDVGWAGYAEIVVFVAVLLAALGYLWREGALDVGPRRDPEVGA